VQELYPGTQVTLGPAIEEGSYYDFAREAPFTPADLQKIEDRMREIVGRDLPIEREVWDREQAKATFAGIGETYKVQIIEDIIPEGEEVSVYRQGDWFDVCRGPHLPSTGKLPKAFKLMKLAGAYWRGDSNNPMLQRIYGTAWRRPRSAITARSARRWICFMPRTRPPAWCFGTTAAGPSILPCRSTSATSCVTTATRRYTRRR